MLPRQFIFLAFQVVKALEPLFSEATPLPYTRTIIYSRQSSTKSYRNAIILKPRATQPAVLSCFTAKV